MSRPPPDRPRLRRVYVDTSAHVCVLLGDEAADRLAAEMSGAELPSSPLIVLEAQRSLVRFVRKGTLDTVQARAAREPGLPA